MIDSAKVPAATQEEQLLYRLWHYRIGHMSDRGLTELSRRGNIPVLKNDRNDLCEPCIFSKQHKEKFVVCTKPSEGVLDLVHSNVWGPAPIAAHGGAKYFVTFIDDFSRKV